MLSLPSFHQVSGSKHLTLFSTLRSPRPLARETWIAALAKSAVRRNRGSVLRVGAATALLQTNDGEGRRKIDVMTRGSFTERRRHALPRHATGEPDARLLRHLASLLSFLGVDLKSTIHPTDERSQTEKEALDDIALLAQSIGIEPYDYVARIRVSSASAQQRKAYGSNGPAPLLVGPFFIPSSVVPIVWRPPVIV